MNSREFRNSVAKAHNISIPGGGILEMCLYVHSFETGALEGEIALSDAYKRVLHAVIASWIPSNRVFDNLVLRLCMDCVNPNVPEPMSHEEELAEH